MTDKERWGWRGGEADCPPCDGVVWQRCEGTPALAPARLLGYADEWAHIATPDEVMALVEERDEARAAILEWAEASGSGDVLRYREAIRALDRLAVRMSRDRGGEGWA